MLTPPRVTLANLPTPLQPLDRLSEKMGVRIWIKRDDMTDTVACGNKIRKLEYSVGQALEENADVLVTWGGVQSNHCRATAAVAARLGLHAHLLLRGRKPESSDGNLLLDTILGADVNFLDPATYQAMDETYERFSAEYADKGLKTFRIPVGASDEIGLWGYINCAEELKQDFNNAGIEPDAIVSATGSGGTLAGLIIGNALHQLETQIYAFNVCDDEAYFVAKIGEDFERWQDRYQSTLDRSQLTINVIDGYVGPGYGRATPQVFQTIHEVAQLEGIVLDPVYTGKAFDAMLQQIRTGRFSGMNDLVFIHTGGIYGLFPQKDEIIKAI
ncbi:MAG: D-cysteine desulfhydrase family protein [Gammaproteobacteria bacterium]|jgi:D-cysteine desulfhydrase|nr:D-cysteine desulfhydrase family protein [Gammaproteobacteria bacterium]MBT7371234.1 D-cysteine desulfhydrase family protein [Gammaproteobacteria bacterium]